MNCYCDSGLAFGECCQPFLTHQRRPETPVQLMRSRYSAFCQEDARYLHITWHSSMRTQNSVEQIQGAFRHTRWCKLSIEESVIDENGTHGSVSFRAYYFEREKLGVLHESSRFEEENGEWRYLDGIIYHDSGRLSLGKNAPCFCGSGSKFKRCCGRH